MAILDETKKKMDAAIDHLHDELRGIRTGRANPAMVENVMVEVYGTSMRIKDLASINTPEPQQLLITPYDAGTAGAIGKGIERANIGFNPIVDGNAVRLNIPPMDQTIRNEMVKVCHKKREEAKVSIRNVRRDSNDAVRRNQKSGDIPEDEMKRLEKSIQEMTDKYCKKADEVTAQKEKEISTI